MLRGNEKLHMQRVDDGCTNKKKKTTKENNQTEVRFSTVELKLLGMLALDIILEPLTTLILSIIK